MPETPGCPTAPIFAGDDAFAALNLIDFLSNLFTASPREHYDRTSLLVILDSVRTNPELIDPDAVVAYEQTTEGV